MEKEKVKRIYEAIKADDLKTFKGLVFSHSDLNLCYGRFPMLSLCYLFGSLKILDKYERFMRGLSNFLSCYEPADAYVAFKHVAGKSIRLFEDGKIVFPVEMLAILGDNEAIAANYENFFKNSEIVLVLQKIYANRGAEAEISQEKFEAQRNKFGSNKKIVISIICLALCLMMVFPWIMIAVIGASSGLGTQMSPIRIRTEAELARALDGGSRYYALERDIELTENLSSAKFSGTLFGNKHKIGLSAKQSGAIFEELSGSVLETIFETHYGSISVKENFAVIAKVLTGEIDGCTVTGDFDFSFDVETDTYASIFVAQNSGKISNSVFEGNAIAINETKNNAFLSAFAGINDGTIFNCKTSDGKFETDTVDVAGIAIDNNGEISSSANNLEIFQSSEKLWHPNSAGIAINNNGKIAGCKNYGKVTSNSGVTQETSEENPDGFALYVAGICCNNVSNIDECLNFGEICAEGKVATIYAGGIVAASGIGEKTIGMISNSRVVCDFSIQSQASGRVTYVGGLVGLCLAGLNLCSFEGDLNISAPHSRIYAGGLTGVSYAIWFNNEPVMISNCYASTSFSHDTYKGGLFGCFKGQSLTNIQIMISNCYYVENGTTAYAGYFSTDIEEEDDTNLSLMNIPQISSITAFSSLAELKKSAKGVRFYD